MCKEQLLKMYPINEEVRKDLLDAGIKIIDFDLDDFNPEDITAIYTHYSLRSSLIWRYVNVKYIICPCTSIQQLIIPKTFKGEVIYLDDKDYLYRYVKSTAEHTVRLMLEMSYVLHKDLSGKRIGLIGFGRVAQQVIEMLEGFKCEISYYDPFTQGPIFNYDNTKVVRQVIDLHDLFANSDIVSLHITDSRMNLNFIKYEHFKSVKKPIIFINTSRAYLVDPWGFGNAYMEGFIEGVAIDEILTWDLLTREKFIGWSKSRDNIIVTNHTAGNSYESRRETDKYVFKKWFKEIGYYDKLKG